MTKTYTVWANASDGVEERTRHWLFGSRTEAEDFIKWLKSMNSTYKLTDEPTIEETSR